MDDTSCNAFISKSNPIILNYYRQFLIKGFDWRYSFILTEFRIQEDHEGQYFVIRFKADILFDYEQGLKKAIYGAVSSYGIDIELIRVEIILIGFSITTKEFSVVLVQFSTLKL